MTSDSVDWFSDCVPWVLWCVSVIQQIHFSNDGVISISYNEILTYWHYTQCSEHLLQQEKLLFFIFLATIFKISFLSLLCGADTAPCSVFFGSICTFRDQMHSAVRMFRKLCVKLWSDFLNHLLGAFIL